MYAANYSIFIRALSISICRTQTVITNKLLTNIRRLQELTIKTCKTKPHKILVFCPTNVLYLSKDLNKNDVVFAEEYLLEPQE